MGFHPTRCLGYLDSKMQIGWLGISNKRNREVEIEEAVHFRIAFPGGSVRGIPNPKCIQAHLPPDRKPTPDEIRKAWNA